MLQQAGLPLDSEAPECPPQLSYLLAWWAEVSATRGGSMAGPQPVRYLELEAWARLTGRRLSPWRVGILRRIDDVFLRTLSDG